MKQMTLCLLAAAIFVVPAFAEQGDPGSHANAPRRRHPEDHYKGIGRKPDFDAAMVLESKGWDQLRDKHFKDAVASFQAAIDKYPQLPVAYMAMGRANERLDNLKDAEAAYRAAVKCDTNNWRGYKCLANLLFQEKNYSEARDALSAASALKPPAAAQRQIDKMIQAVEAARKNGHADRSNLESGDED